MKNPLFKCSLFATPENYEELLSILERFSGSEKTVAYQVAMSTLNLCHSLVERELKESV